jgi:hypothetical protein
VLLSYPLKGSRKHLRLLCGEIVEEKYKWQEQ